MKILSTHSVNKTLCGLMAILVFAVAASSLLSSVSYAQTDDQRDETRDEIRDDHEFPGLELTSPSSRVLIAGSTVPITWTGGNPSWSVLISIIDVERFTVAQTIVASTNNDGSYRFTIPTSLPFEGPCDREYQFYVQNVQVTSWNYGPHFTIECERDRATIIEREEIKTKVTEQSPVSTRPNFSTNVDEKDLIIEELEALTESQEILIEKLEKENLELKQELRVLKKEIADLDQIVREQLKFIYDWVLSRT